ncbi:GNAT family N-acetyltransferase [Sneathiella sp.]|uniref:GNAT family N-acetyltransferase n=1 Tax=Sneathiella sp. TaxID=1964365 RepID=UPI0039E5417C
MSDIDFIIRQATEEDILQIVYLLADDQLGAIREQAENPLPDFYMNAFSQMQQQMGNEQYVVESDGKVIGCMQLTKIAGLSRKGMSRLQIEAVRIDKSIRSSGLGRKMMEFAIEHAKTTNCELVQLTTDLTRQDAHRFYENLGFKASHVGMKLDLSKD